MRTVQGDPAFPTITSDDPTNPHVLNEGLTKREYFAVKILQGLVSNSRIAQEDVISMLELAVTYSDALIYQLNKIKE